MYEMGLLYRFMDPYVSFLHTFGWDGTKGMKYKAN